MNKKATRNNDYNQNEPTLFLAFELGWKKWELAFSIGAGQKPRRRSIEGGQLDSLQSEIASAKKRFGLSKGTKVKSCYEAGRDGFWLHRYLTTEGIENVIVDSSSIEVNRRKRRAKTDRLDAEKLLLLLMRYHHGEDKVWSILRVPSVEEEDRRQLHRELRTVKNDKTRTINRIKGLLATQGIRLGSRLDLSDKRLEAIRLWNGAPVSTALKDRLKREWEHSLFLNKRIAELESSRRSQLKAKKEPDLEKVAQLATLKGIGTPGSWILVRELFGWRHFRNRREVGGLTGLTPTPYDSGASKWEQGISKSGNRHVRAVAVEMAWSWIRHQPKSKLTRWFTKRFSQGSKRARKVGIVALARRLMIDLWKYLERGVIPEGAQLKGACKA